jgi:hypothetical protein
VTLGPHPITGRDDGADFEVFQEHVLKLYHLFVGDVAHCSEVEITVMFLVAFLIWLGDPPAADQDDSMLCELFDLSTGSQDKVGRRKSSDCCFLLGVV